MKKRQLITMTDEAQQLLNDLAFITHGSSDKNKSKTVVEALKRMAQEYNAELKKLEEMRRIQRNANHTTS